MKRLLKWFGWTAACLLLLVLCAAVYIYTASERALNRSYDAPLIAFAAPSDAKAIANGHRQAIVHGCTSCHGAQLEGHVLVDDSRIGRIRAPNLTRVIKQYTDADLERLLRRGIKRNSQGLWVMPVSPHMADDDLEVIIAYLRSVPEREGEPAEIKLGPLLRFAIATGQMTSSARTTVEAQAPLNRSDPISFGRYLVKSACTDCHGSKLEGSELLKSPSLMVMAAYQDADFDKLMRTGIGVGNRTLGKMTEMGRDRFSALTDDEVVAVRSYLREFVKRGGTELP